MVRIQSQTEAGQEGDGQRSWEYRETLGDMCEKERVRCEVLFKLLRLWSGKTNFFQNVITWNNMPKGQQGLFHILNFSYMVNIYELL